MKKLFILSALISFTIFTSCNKEELVDNSVPADQELVTSNTVDTDNHTDNSAEVGQADFTINNEDNTLWEKDDLLLTNNSVNAVSYHWDFGNGETSTEASPAFDRYTTHGPFTITLTVTDALDNTHKVSHDVTVLCIFGGAPHQF